VRLGDGAWTAALPPSSNLRPERQQRRLLTLLYLLTMSLAGLALGQSLTVAPLQLTFNLPSGILNSSETVMPGPQATSTSVSFAVNSVGLLVAREQYQLAD
jgi:hypothetical protein